MAPTAEEIGTTIGNFFRWQGSGGATVAQDTIAELETLVSKDIVSHVIGQEFDLAGKFNGLEALKQYVIGRFIPTFMNALDTSKPSKREILRVLGGGDNEWAILEARGTAVTAKGKPWINDTLILFRYNDEGKICEAKIWFDTLHLQNHLLEATK
ncbi:hypothetical protein F4679DRAFT_564577 [Xylaria curta]|nr:hypothetical protein F4679DRAFT_564577 [Xylaria curta]